MRKAESVGGIVLKEFDGQLKVILAREPDKGPNAWVIPKGHSKPDETMAQTALREIREEVGLEQVQLVKYLGAIVRESKEDWGEVVKKTIHIYLAFALGSETPKRIKDPSVVSSKWFTVQEALDVIPFDEDKLFVKEHFAPILNS